MLSIKITTWLTSGQVLNCLILLTLGVIWGASFLGVELALTGFGPITLAAGRVGAAAIILVTITIVYGDGFPRFQSKTDRRICYIVWVWRFLLTLFLSVFYRGGSKL